MCVYIHFHLFVSCTVFSHVHDTKWGESYTVLWLISFDQDKPMTKSTESAVNTTLWILRTAAWSVICNIKKKAFICHYHGMVRASAWVLQSFNLLCLIKDLYTSMTDHSTRTSWKSTPRPVCFFFFFWVLILCRGPVQSSFLTIPHGVNLNAAKVLAVFQSHVGLLHLHGKW